MSDNLPVDVINGNPAELILVIAPNYHVFKEWCYLRHINVQSSNVRFVDNSERMRGYRNVWYAYLGGPGGIRGINLSQALEHLVNVSGFKNVGKREWNGK